MRLTRRDWIIVLGFLFILFSSTVPVFDASEVMGYHIQKVTFFEFIELKIMRVMN